MEATFIMRNFFLVLILGTTLAACASAPRAVPFENAMRAHKGMTRQEVVALMGAQPDRIMDGGMRYVYADHPNTPATSRSVSFLFGNDGKTVGAAVIGDARR
jgi:hypothetical protein